jgi:hypothetical protein
MIALRSLPSCRYRRHGAQYGRGRRVLEQRKQQVLDCHELVALLARLFVALADRELEIFTEHCFTFVCDLP